jgi:transcriptional regulator with XRE-family HTH domain
MEFGAAIRSARERSGMTLTELARQLGVTKVYVSDVERGRRAPFSRTRLEDVAAILGINPELLYVLSVRSRGHVVLPTDDISDDQNRLAAMLSYRWLELSNDDVNRLIGAL